jgi:hypothetical protein
MTERGRGRLWLSLTLSLALHALLGLALATLSAGEAARAGGPVPVDALVLDSGDGTIILDAPASHGTHRAPAAAGAEEAEEPFTSTVGELPVTVPPPAPAGSGLAPGGDTAPGVRGTGLAGILRPPVSAHKVVFVIDHSLSMGLSGALPVAKRELLGGLAALAEDAQFAVILYNRQAEPLSLDSSAGLLAATESNRAAIARLVDQTRAEGGTDHLAALRRAVALGADVIYFVTDADEMTIEQVRNVALLNRGRAAIHTVEISDERERAEETPLKLLARLTGGTHRVVAVSR